MHALIANNRFNLLNTAEVTLDISWSYFNVMSPFYRLYYIKGGSGTVHFAGTELNLRSGFLYLIPDFQLSHYECTDFLHQLYIHFEEEMAQGVSVKSIYRIIHERKATDLDIALINRILEINPDSKLPSERPSTLSEVQVSRDETYQLRRMETQAILQQLLARFMTGTILAETTDTSNDNRISKALQYIHKNLDQELSVAYLASLAHLNPDYFSRIFYELVGQRPIPYIHQLRIQKAQYLLLFSEATHDEIAELTGFPNRPYFAKIFKRYTGLSVGQYRNQSPEV
ncbi:AraC family transcriptional regulator [Dyadobacter tibetensis]|uniref:AraC family transcriptional regulator n=1 Tax=Dyadobacter tibetensis TaxID=1211851 RepID=UPI00047175C5|nr:AraC family transcriptional regulator [Dyadobacter tibetensis]